MPKPRRLFLHVGLQKTGTSYLQSVLLDNAAALADQGLDLVPATKRGAFEVMLLVRGRYNPERDPHSAAGALDRLAAALADAPGDRAVLSQESLAAASPRQLRTLLEACEGREVHVVVTARDLGRGLSSSWQQELKSGRTPTFEEWLHRLREAQRAGRAAHPWIHLDPAAVLGRWSSLLPTERLHLVTVPPPGTAPTLLLERFASVLEVDPTGLVPKETASNTSLGLAQAEVLRRVNRGLPDELRRRQVYGDVGKRFFASQVLGPQAGRRIRVPADLRDWCEEAGEQQITALAEGGYDVRGDLADLRCRDDSFEDRAAEPPEGEVAAAAIAALVSILTQRSHRELRRRQRHQRPRRLRRPRWQRVAEALRGRVGA